MKLKKLRDWNWSSYTDLPSIPYLDQVDLLTKLKDKVISNGDFCREIKRLQKLHQGFGELCSVLETWAAVNRTRVLGQYCSKVGVGPKNPFDARQLYVREQFQVENVLPWNVVF